MSRYEKQPPLRQFCAAKTSAITRLSVPKPKPRRGKMLNGKSIVAKQKKKKKTNEKAPDETSINRLQNERKKKLWLPTRE